MRNLKGIIKVGQKNAAQYKNNQKQFVNYYNHIGHPVTPPNEKDFERVIRKHLIKRQDTPKHLKIMTKDFRPGWASQNERAKIQGSSPIGKNYQKYIDEMDRNYQPKYNVISNMDLPGEERFM